MKDWKNINLGCGVSLTVSAVNMGKKGRSSKVEEEEDEVTTDEEGKSQGCPDLLNSCSTKCPHVGKAIHVSAIKKALKISWVRVGQCGPCTRSVPI